MSLVLTSPDLGNRRQQDSLPNMIVWHVKKKDYRLLTSDEDSSVVTLSIFVSADNFGWAWISIGGGTSITSFSKSSPASVADGEIMAVTPDGDEDDSVILKIPFIPPLPSIDLLAEF